MKPAFFVVLFDGHVRPHVVPVDLVQEVVDDVFDRHRSPICDTLERFAKDAVYFDLGGPVCSLNGKVASVIDGVEFVTLLRDVDILRDQLREAAPRTLNGKVFYKLHSHIHSIVLSESQRVELLKAWELPDLEERLVKEDAAIGNTIRDAFHPVPRIPTNMALN